MADYLILHALMTAALALVAGAVALLASDANPRTDPEAAAVARKAARVVLTAWAWPVWLVIVLARAAVWIWHTATEPGGSE